MFGLSVCHAKKSVYFYNLLLSNKFQSKGNIKILEIDKLYNHKYSVIISHFRAFTICIINTLSNFKSF